MGFEKIDRWVKTGLVYAATIILYGPVITGLIESLVEALSGKRNYQS